MGTTALRWSSWFTPGKLLVLFGCIFLTTLHLPTSLLHLNHHLYCFCSQHRGIQQSMHSGVARNDALLRGRKRGAPMGGCMFICTMCALPLPSPLCGFQESKLAQHAARKYSSPGSVFGANKFCRNTLSKTFVYDSRSIKVELYSTIPFILFCTEADEALPG